jgi:CheY-like chemotaxis protein
MQPHDRARILVVDDVADDADAMVTLLELDGYEVRTAGDGVHALEVTAEFQPHCVLLDIGMPRMDGLELAKIMRQRFGDSIVLIAITGRSIESLRVAQTLDRVDHYLRKPVDPGQLRKVLPPL